MRVGDGSLLPRARRAGGAHRVAPRAGACGLLVAVAVGLSGCAVKGADNANLILGKQAFVAKCGACHTLARANTKGIVGPNLDAVFQTSLAEGVERNADAHGRRRAGAEPEPRGRRCRKHLASGATLADIAAYVAQSADAPGPDTGLLASAVEAVGAGKPAVEKAGKLEIDANPTGQLAYTTSKAEATPGPVTITMSNMSGVMHNIAVEAGENGATPRARRSARAASSARAPRR